jgi:predicted phosphodiesterase
VRLVLTSDLHIDHHPEVVPLVAERARELRADVLIVAGDVSVAPDHVEATLRALRPAARAGIYVPGNHDLWTTPGGPTSRARYEDVLPTLARGAGFFPLGQGPIEIDGISFVGVTGWYDFSLRNRALDDTFTDAAYRAGSFGRLRWNDVHRVVWPDDDGRPMEAPEICAAQVRSLERQLREVDGRPSVVVTHHLPFAELVTSMGELPWDFLNGFMGSSLLGDAIRRAHGVRLVCSGHTHFRKSVVVDGADGPLRAEVSPVGYPREYRRAGLDLAARVRERVSAFDV